MQSQKPATYTCPFCERRLHAMSDHLLIAPEGDGERRRHAHRECVLAAKRYVSLASIVGACTLPVTTLAMFTIAGRQHWLLQGSDVDSAGPWPFVGLTGIIAILVVVKHRANLARIMAGTEPKLGDRKHKAGR